MKKFLLRLIILLPIIVSCTSPQHNKESCNGTDSTLSGNLVIFHAGSLSLPVKSICDSFVQKHPDVTILKEAAGSKDCARKISDLGKRCDVMLSSDYKVIDDLLIPKYADWNIRFAANEMAIVYHGQSRYADEINKDNWFEVLMKKDVVFGRSDPNSDPCGVRSLMTMMLAEKYYQKTGLAKKLSSKDQNYIRPKETDLIALLESGAVDYIFLYRSVAEQHKLKFVLLPDEINLKNEKYAEQYATVSVQTTGKKPGELITETGAPMVYGLTIPKNAPNKKVAEAFVAFLLDAGGGMAILEANGQPSVVPSFSDSYNKIPAVLKRFANP
jgi:molybdate/tungstate transport system substrate-binding protein